MNEESNERSDEMCTCDHHRELHRSLGGGCGGKSRYNYPNTCECGAFVPAPQKVSGFGWNPCAPDQDGA